MSLRFDEETLADDGIRERELSFEADGERVPGLLWLPTGGDGPRPLVLAGHGFGVDRHWAFPRPALRSLVTDGGCAVAILDAPCHGDRRPDPTQGFEVTAAAWQAYWRANVGSRVAREHASAARLLQARPEVGAGPVGYWGLSLATQYGLAYLACDEPPRGAVLGLFRHGPVVAHYARQVRCPVFFIEQQDDEIHPRAEVTALFDELASPDKHLASSPGAHTEVPDAVCRAAVEFLLRVLRPS